MTNSADPDQLADLDLQFAKTGHVVFSKRRVKRLYLLNRSMEVSHTCPGARYWSEVLCYTILTHMSDPEVKVRDLGKSC